MIESFFGIHPFVVRSGQWKEMRPGEKDLYVYLMEQSERRCTRQLRVRDADIEEVVGIAPRTLCNARKKLQERGLISCCRGEGGKYEYLICDPKTGKPYPGHPRDPIVVPKRWLGRRTPGAPSPSPSPPPPPPYAPAAPGDALEKHGIKLSFRKAATYKSIAALKLKR